LHHRPRPRQRVVGRGYFVVKDVWVRPVEIETLPDDGLVVIGHRHAGQVPLVWTADVARLDLERVVAAAAIAIDPSTDRVTGKGRLLILGKGASVGIDATRVGGRIFEND